MTVMNIVQPGLKAELSGWRFHASRLAFFEIYYFSQELEPFQILGLMRFKMFPGKCLN